MFRIRKKIIFSLLTVLFLLMLNVPNVFAAKPLALHIEVDEYFVDTTPEPFTASGSAVDDGLVCAAGDVYDVNIDYHGNSNGPFTSFKVHKHFICGDSSGTFDIEMNVKLEKASGETKAQWKIIAGTGAYAQLKGNGSLIGIPNVPGSIITDYYDGKVH